MQIRILFFAGVADTVGRRSARVELPDGAVVGQLMERLQERYPHASDIIRHSVIAVNQEYAESSQTLRESDEIALIPPVSGGQEPEEEPMYQVTEKPLSSDEMIRRVSNPYAGALLTFSGTVREFTRGRRTVSLEYEAYAPMAVKKMEAIGAEIRERWPEVQAAMAHRVGKLDIEEISVIIAVASPHRAEAFEAGRYAIERLKEIVPVWKKEVWEDGSEWKGHQTGP
ncbi:molybdopterin converting factor subunit 1 [Paludifilum halophilum]|uniref:Molybdopterin synthase catalytic subunit n=1 Tax=Paludifilum halophilum TaxID=1642702 RepID=A0A235B3J7_9BACL|nr:molybdopterin converting factor subunit 1 [Paludifilum halophilum]OYD06843.1 molybdopterin converting factor subunit 1 [Paludifilum halophilum]